MIAFKNPLAVGITGGIGSGKSTAAEIFASLGARVLFADAMAKELVRTDERVRRRIQKEFGEQIVARDGAVDTKQLARLVFSDPLALDKLNEIIHPSVLEVIAQEIESFKHKPESEFLAVEAALLFEADADEMFDYIIVVDADEEERIGRVMNRDGSARSDVVRRMEAQMPASEKLERADFVLRNSGDRDALKEKCKFIFSLLRTIARSGEGSL